MKNDWRLWGTFLLLVTLHFLLHVGLGLGRVAPDLLTVALLIASREVPTGVGAALGFGLGVMEDAFSVLAFGANTIALTIVGALGARSRDLFLGDSVWFLGSYLAAGKWVRDLVYWIGAGEAVRGPFAGTMLVDAPLAAVYAALVGYVVVAFTGRDRVPSR